MPNFIQQPINYAAQYARELANAYPYLSYYADLWNQGESRRWRPHLGKQIFIPSMTTSGSRAVDRDHIDGIFNRNFNIDWQLATLQMDREWDTLIDPMDMVETNEVATIANVSRTFNQFQKMPEMDAYMSSSLANAAIGFGGVDNTQLTAENILNQWDAALAEMADQRVDRRLLRCKMTPETYTLLKQAAGITRFIQLDNGINDVDRNIARLDGVYIQEVPSDMMLTDYDLDVGWAPVSGAAQINFLLYDVTAVAAPIVYETSMISPPSAQSKGKWLYYERYYYGFFPLRQRQAGLFANISGTRVLGSLTVSTAAGTTSGASTVTVQGDQFLIAGGIPAGLDLLYTTGAEAQSLTYGSDLPSAVWQPAYNSTINLTGATAGQTITVALVNHQSGKVVAGGSAVIVAGT